MVAFARHSARLICSGHTTHSVRRPHTVWHHLLMSHIGCAPVMQVRKHLQQQSTVTHKGWRQLHCGDSVCLHAQVREDKAQKTAAKGGGTPEEDAGAATHVGGPQKAAGV